MLWQEYQILDLDLDLDLDLGLELGLDLVSYGAGTAIGHFCNGTGRAQCRVQFNSVPDGIHARGKAHIRSTPSLRSFPMLN